MNAAMDGPGSGRVSQPGAICGSWRCAWGGLLTAGGMPALRCGGGSVFVGERAGRFGLLPGIFWKSVWREPRDGRAGVVLHVDSGAGG